MNIKDISVRTFKNHIETEVSFEPIDFKDGCYLVQTVSPAIDAERIVCQMTTGIPCQRVLSCADAVPAIPSTEKQKFLYNLVTQVFDGEDRLVDEKTVTFEFTLPDYEPERNRNSFFSKLFGN